ncbi:MAG: sarcosine oxidase subunit delta [Anaerolineales bacterium]|nr:sarcosine oxidase subunit delta [Anaerolineales bacterium]
MSIQIPCPHCGKRPIQEFSYGEIPVVPDDITDPDARDLDRAFMRANPEGPAVERWFHTYGCCRWLTLRRDTRTDTVLEATAN